MVGVHVLERVARFLDEPEHVTANGLDFVDEGCPVFVPGTRVIHAGGKASPVPRAGPRADIRT
jgi:hypothetical protein